MYGEHTRAARFSQADKLIDVEKPMNAASGLQRALDFLGEKIAPQAMELDASEPALHEAWKAMAEAELFALRTPELYGGFALGEADNRAFQQACSRASGVFAFLQTQHQSAVSMLAKSDNEALKQRLLPGTVSGETRIGLGFSQLRRPGKPLVTAEPTDDGYRISGHIPWITGESYFRDFVIGAELPSGEQLFGITSLAPREGLELSEPMRLAAMETARTVTAEVRNLALPEANVIAIHPPGQVSRNDRFNVTLQAHFAVGCARAGVDILRESYRRRSSDFLLSAADSLTAEIEDCNGALAEANDRSYEEKVPLRAWAIDLAVRCAHAGVVSCSGAAASLQHPAQRVYREALVFSVSAQTTDIMQATLERLTARSDRPSPSLSSR